MPQIPDYFNNPDPVLLSKVASAIDNLNPNADNIFNTCFRKSSKLFDTPVEEVKQLIIGTKFPVSPEEIELYNFTCHQLKNIL